MEWLLTEWRERVKNPITTQFLFTAPGELNQQNTPVNDSNYDGFR